MKSKRKALVVGISRYEELQDLVPCESDAVKMCTLLRNSGYCLFDFNDHLIGSVSFFDLRSSIVNFFTTDVGPEDTLIFYFSGHGLIDQTGRHYLSTSQVCPEKPYSHGYPLEELLQMAKASISRRIIIMLDCCYSGGIIANEDMIKSYHTKIFGVLPNLNSKVCVLASSQAYQLSYIMNSENSLFTSFLLKGIAGDPDAVDEDGKVTPASLFNFSYNRVTSISVSERNDQKPFSVTNNSELEKVIVEYPSLSNKRMDSHIIVRGIEKLFSEGRKNEIGIILHYIASYGEQYIHSGNYVKAKEYYNDKSIYSHVAVLHHNQGWIHLLIDNFVSLQRTR